MSLCDKCESGPQGIRGHEDLQLLHPKTGTRPPERFVLACLQCGARWCRIFRSDGITWTRADPSAA